MSENALKKPQSFDRGQAHRNDARCILQRVVLALDSQRSSGVRWPFELLQNAYEFGAREGQDLVEIEFSQHNEQLVVSRNGRIFSIPELKALLSGGWNKEFDGIDTTGRFGTGFLVTHAISSRVDVNGILQTVNGRLETFQIELNRPPDKARILKNIELTDEAFGAAQAAPGTLNVPTVTFTYHNANAEVVRAGLDRLEQTIPNLYETCDNLVKVRIRRAEKTVVFRRTSPFAPQFMPRAQRNTRLVAGTVEDQPGRHHVQASPQHRLFAVLKVARIPRVIVVQNGNECGGVNILEVPKGCVPGAGCSGCATVLRIDYLDTREVKVRNNFSVGVPRIQVRVVYYDQIVWLTCLEGDGREGTLGQQFWSVVGGNYGSDRKHGGHR